MAFEITNITAEVPGRAPVNVASGAVPVNLGSLAALDPSMTVPAGHRRVFKLTFDIQEDTNAANNTNLALRVDEGDTASVILEREGWADNGGSIEQTVNVPGPASPPLTLSAWIVLEGIAVNATALATVQLILPGPAVVNLASVSVNVTTAERVALELVLDRSGSMQAQIGTGQTRIARLKEAAKRALTLLQTTDYYGMVSFSSSATTDTDRELFTDPTSAEADIDALVATGSTAIGAGVAEGLTRLNASGLATNTKKSLLVITDGHHNTGTPIEDVVTSGDTNIYAVGIGGAGDIDTGKLDTLTNTTGAGYLLLTGALTSGGTGTFDFRLDKFMIQVLAQVSNSQIVLDPSGMLSPGQVVSVPFPVSEAEREVRVAILVPDSRLIDLVLTTPSGARVDPQKVTGLSITRRSGIVLVEFAPQTVAAQVKCKGIGHFQINFALSGHAKELGKKLGPVPYSVIVLAKTGIALSARIDQNSLEIGGMAFFSARVTEYDFPVANAKVWADLTHPDGATTRLDLQETSPGRFEASLQCKVQGVYSARIHATGKSLLKSEFHRELTRNAYVYPGGDADRAGEGKTYGVPLDERNPDGSIPESSEGTSTPGGTAPGGTRPGSGGSSAGRCCDCVPLDKVIELLRAAKS